MKTWLTIVAVLALAAAAYEWPTSKTVPVFTSWLGPVGERTQGTPGGSKTITIFAGGGGSSLSSQSGVIEYGVNEKGTRYTYSPDGGTIYVLK